MTDVPTLLGQLKAGRVSAEETLKHWLSNAEHANTKVNAIVQCVKDSDAVNPMAVTALAYAKALDKKAPKMPLHGIPVSVKECFLVAGTDSTIGFRSKRGRPQLTDAALVSALRSLGAIPFCKTNVPTTMMAWDCWSGAYGQTFHPLSKEYGPGGSSGGEAALIGAGGSMVGIGTDVGGSVRIPAAFSGCVGFKPSTSRLPNKGMTPKSAHKDGQHSIASQAGLMGMSVSNVTQVVSSLLAPQSVTYMRTMDASLLPIPWRHHRDLLPATRTKLRFGYYTTDGLLEVSPACRRAVLETVDKLRDAGYEVVEFTPIPGDRVMRCYLGCTVQNKQFFTRERMLGDEEVRGNLARLISMTHLPMFVQKMINWFVGWMSPTFKKFFSATLLTENYDLHCTRAEARSLMEEHHDRVNAADIDIIISPVNALPAAKIGAMDKYYLMCMSYVAIYNLTNSPAGTVPVTRVAATDVDWVNKDTRGDVMINEMRAQYEQMVEEGLPFTASVQLAGKLYHDEQVLEAMGIVEELSNMKSPIPLGAS